MEAIPLEYRHGYRYWKTKDRWKSAGGGSTALLKKVLGKPREESAGTVKQTTLEQFDAI